MSGRTLTRSGVARVNVTDVSSLFLTSDIRDLTCRIVSVDLPSTAMMVESLVVDLHQSIRASGVEGVHFRRSIRLVLVWILSCSPMVGWLPLIGIVTSVELPNRLVDSTKSSGTPAAECIRLGTTLSSSSGIKWRVPSTGGSGVEVSSGSAPVI